VFLFCITLDIIGFLREFLAYLKSKFNLYCNAKDFSPSERPIPLAVLLPWPLNFVALLHERILRTLQHQTTEPEVIRCHNQIKLPLQTAEQLAVCTAKPKRGEGAEDLEANTPEMFIKQRRNELLTSCRASPAIVAKFFCLPGVNTYVRVESPIQKSILAISKVQNGSAAASSIDCELFNGTKLKRQIVMPV